MKITIYPLIFACALSGACAKSPSACITLPHSNPFKVGEQIKFDGSCSTHARYYQWFYKDGTFSEISDNPTAVHSYSMPGTYTPKLKAEGKNSNESNIEKEVIVEQ